MKKLALLFFLVFSSLYTMAVDEAIVLRNCDPQHNHSGIPTPADMPDVYHDTTNQDIIIDGLGVVNYYDVEIASATSFVTVVSTQVNGYYDTIDISSLPQGEYVITIESPLGNTYEGFFEIL